ncbi:NlpC/P60 family protein [Ammoniphilus sp. CFH 90114]|uniref:NlpC/P60 family protein n=1 Tax=Ammoniphilus sp. CFH 90114 TaxID=2493665 RepID=UPI00100DEC8B|nr:NlpC/P60 family protein [Ammoniphilus sp. CFH 90114]RXT06982.1 hypothetical protein EIZ39_12545 [Ammoniphilus sp. CFH 90114]
MAILHKTLLSSLLATSLLSGVALADQKEESHYRDLHDTPWATSSIQKLYNEGMLRDFKDAVFLPAKAITRAEFVSLLSNAIKEEVELKAVPFHDVNPNDWFYESIKKLYSMGMIKGVDENAFHPEKAISREEAAVIAAHAFGYSHKGNPPLYKDYKQISPWARSSVAALFEHDIMLGSNQHFRPKDSLTRAETAVLLHRILHGSPPTYAPPPQKTPSKEIKKVPSFKKKLVKNVNMLLETPYRWGGATIKGFDCSGFTQYVFKELGVELPRTTREQFKVGKIVSMKKMKVGDLIFFDTGKGYISHVGIYMGDKKMAHVGSKGVKIDKLDWYYKNYRVVGIKRIERK